MKKKKKPHGLGNEAVATQRVLVPLNNLITLILSAQECGCDSCKHAVARICGLACQPDGTPGPNLHPLIRRAAGDQAS